LAPLCVFCLGMCAVLLLGWTVPRVLRADRWAL
jgi:hypothetical protein